MSRKSNKLKSRLVTERGHATHIAKSLAQTRKRHAEEVKTLKAELSKVTAGAVRVYAPESLRMTRKIAVMIELCPEMFLYSWNRSGHPEEVGGKIRCLARDLAKKCEEEMVKYLHDRR